MSIRFKCPHCKKPLVVKDHLAGKRAACPVCKKPVPIPVPTAPPADVETFAAAALTDAPAKPPPQTTSTQTIDFECPYCSEPQHVGAELSGKQTPCSECKRIIKVPVIEVKKPKDWREIAKKGPTAALVNLPEQLAGAWGTELKTHVRGSSLMEADALPVAEAEPVGVLGWLKRGFWTTAILGVIMLGYLGISKMRVTKAQKNDEREAQTYMDAKPDMYPLLTAELHRAIGELKLRDRKAAEARDRFIKSRANFNPGQDTVPAHEQDMLLIDLAVLQVGLGGSEDEERDKMRYAWEKSDNVPQKEIQATFQQIRSLEAKAAGLREVATRLADKDKLEIALGLARILAVDTGGDRSPLVASHAALLIAQKKVETAGKRFKTPPVPGQAIDDAEVRQAYAEGYARLGEHAKAMQVVTARGRGLDRLQAGVAAAAIILSDPKQQDGRSKAADFIRAAVEAIDDLKDKDNPPTWELLQLIKVGARTDAAAQVKPLIPKLGPPGLRSWGQFYAFAGQLERSKEPANQDLLNEALREMDEASPARAFAWQAFARQNARLGNGSAVRDQIPDLPEGIRPFVHMGLALGEQDARQ